MKECYEYDLSGVEFTRDLKDTFTKEQYLTIQGNASNLYTKELFKDLFNNLPKNIVKNIVSFKYHITHYFADGIITIANNKGERLYKIKLTNKNFTKKYLRECKTK